MSNWTGQVAPIPAVSASSPCSEYLSIADARAEFGDRVADMTDAQMQRKIDRMAGLLEDAIGHTFGRAMVARSTGADVVAVTATKLTIGGTDYAFADYPTLYALAAAVNAAGETYSLEILPQVYANTPSTLLSARTAEACGPAYENRVILCASALYAVFSGDGTSHVFLPLPPASVESIVENGVTLPATGYWWKPGDPWIIRKWCGCYAETCAHPKGRWSASYPNNIAVTFVPQWWGRVPVVLSGLMLEAFESQVGLGPLESESFGGEYSYRRSVRAVATPQDALGGVVTRQYAVRFQP
jgi:hypothetical protein